MTREELINHINYNLEINADVFLTDEDVRMVIKALEQEPKTGHWINLEDRTDWYNAVYKCSCCGREIITPYELKNNLYSDYPCCHCGAKMIEHNLWSKDG